MSHYDPLRSAAIEYSNIAVLLFIAALALGCGHRPISQSNSTHPEDVVNEPVPHIPASGETTVTPPNSISEMVERFDDAVAFITVSDALGNDIAVGTGCIIGRSGLIATNRHVIESGVSARVQLRDETQLPVTGYVAVDVACDLAIIKVDGLPESIEPFALGAPPPLRPGDALIAIGHPNEFRFTVSDGILSAIRQTHELPDIYQQGLHLNPRTRWLQTTAAISNGSSGGPLLTISGELVGINTWVAEGRNLGFAISVEHLSQLRNSISPQPKPLPLPDASVIVGSSVASLSRDYDKELQEFAFRLQSAEDRNAFVKMLRGHPAPTYLAKCLQAMLQSDADSDRVDALLLAHQIWPASTMGSQAGRRHLVKMYELANGELAQGQAIQRAVLLLGNGSYCPQLSTLLRKMFLAHPQPSVRARAGLALVNAMQNDSRAERYIPDQIELLERLKTLFPDEEINSVRIEEAARESLVQLRSLRVGAKAQNLAGRDHLGSPLRLSDYNGRVVVLDFWADWSPACRSMYPQKRELVEQLKDLPFALLGVNCDETSQRVASLIDSNVVNWKDVYDGPSGRLAATWLVEDLPATYVLDRRGTIRFTNVRDQQLDEAVHALLEEELVSLPQDIMPTGGQWRWHYSSDLPPENWTAPNFEDSSWDQGAAPLGYGDARINTTLDYGDIDNKPLTACFRAGFHVNDPSFCKRLICELDADDGAIVYLNGFEVLRTNLPDSATTASPALLAATSSLVAELDPKYLVAGLNVLAVEVHQVDSHSADLIFDLSLSSRGLDPDPILTAKSDHTKLRFCQLTAQFEDDDGTVDKTLESLQNDESPVVAAWALATRIQRATKPNDVPLPEADEKLRQIWRAVANELNAQVWEVVVLLTLSDGDARRALRKSHAMWLLEEGDEAESAANAANTYGVALFRTGRFREANTFFRKSMELGGKNALDLAYLSLALNCLGDDEGALDMLAEAEAFQKKSTWLGEDAAAVVLEAARAAIHKNDSIEDQ